MAKKKRGRELPPAPNVDLDEEVLAAAGTVRKTLRKHFLEHGRVWPVAFVWNTKNPDGTPRPKPGRDNIDWGQALAKGAPFPKLLDAVRRVAAVGHAVGAVWSAAADPSDSGTVRVLVFAETARMGVVAWNAQIDSAAPKPSITEFVSTHVRTAPSVLPPRFDPLMKS